MFRRIETFGLEEESFLCDERGNPINTHGMEHPMNGQLTGTGVFGSDAGVGLCEVAGDPASSLDEALWRIYKLQSGLNPSWQFHHCAFRPASMGGKGVWVLKPRYVALQDAAVMEVGEKNASWINHMTNVAAVHVNVSGKFNPVGFEGMFLFNLLNNVAPAIAAKVHQELKDGKGHLGVWQKFADTRRFPMYGLWLPTIYEFQGFFENIPRMIEEEKPNSDVWVARPQNPDGTPKMQVWGDSIDMGVFWHFVRIKLSPDGEWYIEIRVLPSMGNVNLRQFSGLIVDIVEVLLEWFFNKNDGKPVMDIQGAIPACEFAHQYFPDYFPPEPLNGRDWNRLRNK